MINSEKFRVNSIFIHDDEPSDMTFGRRLAMYLSKYSWYNPALNLYPVERITIADDATHVSTVSPPNLGAAWEYFEHNVLPRSTVVREDRHNKAKGIKYQRVEPGVVGDGTKLYPVWNTPLTDLSNFGLGVVILFLAGCINIPNMISFWNAHDESMTSHFTLRASAICTNTSWVPCTDKNCTSTVDGYRGFVSKDRIAFDVGSDMAFLLRNNCELPPRFGVFTLSSMGFLFTAMYVFMYFQNIKAKEMNSRPTSSHYSIQIMNPPPNAKDPNEWKAFFESKFRGTRVKVCSIIVDNEILIKKLVRRRQLLHDLHNSLPAEVGLNEKRLDAIIGHAWEPNLLKRIFFCKKNIQSVVKTIQNLGKDIQNLGKVDYNVSGVFVTFEKQHDQQRILRGMQAPLSCKSRRKQKLHYKGVCLNIRQPGEPFSIRWGDLEEGPLLRLCERFVSFLVSILIIVGGSFIILGMKELGPIAVSITITIMNAITPSLVSLMSSFESHSNVGSYTGSIYLKVTAIRWINTTILLWLLTPFTDTLRDGEYLLATVRNLYIAEIIQRPIVQLSDILGQLKRHYFAPRAPDQRRMNALFISPYFDIGERYTEITKVLFLTFYYATLMPSSFFYASAIFLVSYWVDKFCILKTLRQGPRINSEISTLSMYVFFMIVLAYSVMASYSIAQYPFDNVCLNRNDTLDENLGGTYTLAFENGIKTFDITLPENSPSYQLCDQDMMRYRNPIAFPPFPRYQKQEWMTESQEILSRICGLTSIFILFMLAVTVFQRLVKSYLLPLFFNMKKERRNLSEVTFGDLPEMFGYIPQVFIPEFCYPQLVCEIKPEHRNLIGWVDANNQDYRFHNMIYDVKKRGKGAFSTIKSWNLG